MFEKISIFPTMVYRTKVDPDSYDKKQLIKAITDNFKKSPFRSQWDNTAYMHHYYNDWDNPKFKKINLENLKKVYAPIIHTFMNDFNFTEKINYNWVVANITACQNSHFMGEHDHLVSSDENTEKEGTCYFTAVHYMKFKPNQNGTTFLNPLMISQYDTTLGKFKKILQNTNEYSAYHQFWTFDTQEDDFIIIPSYLKHKILRSNQPDDIKDLRITGVVNINIEGY
jgi:hypothetical protein